MLMFFKLTFVSLSRATSACCFDWNTDTFFCGINTRGESCSRGSSSRLWGSPGTTSVHSDWPNASDSGLLDVPIWSPSSFSFSTEMLLSPKTTPPAITLHRANVLWSVPYCSLLYLDNIKQIFGKTQNNTYCQNAKYLFPLKKFVLVTEEVEFCE